MMTRRARHAQIIVASMLFSACTLSVAVTWADDPPSQEGIEFFENNSTSLRAHARMYLPSGDSSNGAFGGYASSNPTTNGNYHFSYNYDPTFENDTAHAGPEGKIAARIWNDALTYDQSRTNH
jgi:hypothetical protein